MQCVSIPWPAEQLRRVEKASLVLNVCVKMYYS